MGTKIERNPSGPYGLHHVEQDGTRVLWYPPDPPPPPPSVAGGRPVFSRLIPESARVMASDPWSVSLMPPRVADEAAVAAIQGPARVAALLSMCIYAVDGKPVDHAADGAGQAFSAMGSKCRELVAQLWKDISIPSDQETADFLAHQTIMLA